MNKQSQKKVTSDSIKIHKKVLADIISEAIGDIKGVRLVKGEGFGKIRTLFGRKDFSGIKIKVDGQEKVHLEVKVLIGYGLNIPTIAKEIQETLRRILEKSVDIDLKDINVNIQGIERGTK